MLSFFLSLDAAAGNRAAALYHGKVEGLFKPLGVDADADAFVVTGETFRLRVSRLTGQVDQLSVNDVALLAPGAMLPNPYIGLPPEDDPGATFLGPTTRPHFGFEKAAVMRPILGAADLTGARRVDAAATADIEVQLLMQQEDTVQLRSTGAYVGTPLRWQIDYNVEADGFTRVEVALHATQTAQLRWHCYQHTMLHRSNLPYLTELSEPAAWPLHIQPQTGRDIRGTASGAPLMESSFKPFFSLDSEAVGVEFSKQDFGDRHSGYHDSGVVLPDGRWVQSNTVQAPDGRTLEGYDSRGKASAFTQLVAQGEGLELEEFDVRNTLLTLRSGEVRRRVFWFQPVPPKLPRQMLQGQRIVWVGPNQPVAAGWRGAVKPWEPPTESQLQLWAQLGATTIVGGLNSWSGGYAQPLQPELTRQFLDAAHRHGLQVLPYVSLSDFSYADPAYAAHAVDWLYSADIEFAQETSLMCFQAVGWRDHVVNQWDALLTAFPFDGLYIDQWDTRLCHNSRHGCGGYPGTYATEGYRDFLRRARHVVAAHTAGQGIVMLNANLLRFAGATAWCDIRLNGENDAPPEASEVALRTTLSGTLQGLQSASIWPAATPAQAAEEVLAAAGTVYPMMPAWRPETASAWYHATTPSVQLTRDLWNAQRFFSLPNAHGRLTAHHAIYERDGRSLVIMGPQAAGQLLPMQDITLSPKSNYRLLDLRRARALLHRADLPTVRQLHLPPSVDSLAILLLEPEPAKPGVAFFRGADAVTVAQQEQTLNLTLGGEPGGWLELFLDAEMGPVEVLTPGFLQTSNTDFIVLRGVLPVDGKLQLRKMPPQSSL